MIILYLGSSDRFSTSFHRAMALIRLGHQVHLYDSWQSLNFVLKNRVFEFLCNRTGYVFLQFLVFHYLCIFLKKTNKAFDLIWVNGGELYGKKIIHFLKGFNVPIVLYNNDDPTGCRDFGRFYSLKKALPFYDLCVTVRDCTAKEMKKMNAKNVFRVWMSYDEHVHSPPSCYNEIPDHFKSDVSFVGTWMRHENRHILMRKLVDANINLKIFGPRWEKCGDDRIIRKCWKSAFVGNRDYVYALAGAKCSIGLLSQGNRDLHTRRSVEIPFAGGVLCAEKTSEHTYLYRENIDAVFWENSEELILKCRQLLENSYVRNSIRLSGMERVRMLGVGNETVCKSILERAVQCRQRR